jgi:hypothetical protein
MSLLAHAIVVNFCSPAFGNEANSARTPFRAAALPSALRKVETKRDQPTRLFSFFHSFSPTPMRKKLICEIECGKRAHDELLTLHCVLHFL